MAEELRLSATVVDKFSQPLKELRTRLRDIKTPTGLKDTNRHFLDMHRSVKLLTSQLRGGLGAALGAFGLGAVGVAAAVDGIARSVRDFGGSATALSSFNKATGISIKLLKELRAVAPIHGISSDAVEGDLRRLADVRNKARHVGGNMAARALIGGVPLDEHIMRAKTDDDYVERVLAAIAQQKSGEARKAVAQAYGVGDLAALGDSGLGALNAQRGRMRGSLSPISAADIDKAAKFQEAISRLGNSFDSLKEELGSAVAPAIADLVADLSHLVDANRDIIKTDVAAFFKTVTDVLKSEDWAADGEAIKNVFGDLRSFFNVFYSVPHALGLYKRGPDGKEATKDNPAIDGADNAKAGQWYNTPNGSLKKGSVLQDDIRNVPKNAWDGLKSLANPNSGALVDPAANANAWSLFNPTAYHPGQRGSANGVDQLREGLHRIADLSGVDIIAAGVEKGMRALMTDGAAAASGNPLLSNASYSPASGGKLGGRLGGSGGKFAGVSGGDFSGGSRVARGSLAKNQQLAYQAALANHLGPEAARVLMANDSGESLRNPHSLNWDVKQWAHGIAQWDGPRSNRMKKEFYLHKLPNEMSVAEQIQAQIWEMKRYYPKVWATLNDSHTTAAQKMHAMINDYERPAQRLRARTFADRMAFHNGFKPLASAAKAAHDLAAPAAAAPASGKAHLDVHFHNAPKGISTKADGGGLFTSTRVQRGSLMAPALEI